MFTTDSVRKAYKKLKSYALYDKGLFFLRDRIADLESKSDLESFFKEVVNIVNNGCNLSIINEISYVCLPKGFENKTGDGKTSNVRVISNVFHDVTVDKVQYYIDMPLELFVIGSLWVMIVGSQLDLTMSANSYGNRVNNYVNNNSNGSWSPYLFKIYYHQYSQWRDKALKVAEERYSDHKHVFFISTDIKSFFYNVDIVEARKDIDRKIEDKKCVDEYELTEIVFKIIEKYGEKIGRKTVLPIGFPPSGVIANLFLDTFDREIMKEISPDYYGRYVDDIVIVKSFDSDGLPSDHSSLSGIFNCKCLDDEHISISGTDSQLHLNINKDKTKILVVNPQYPASILDVLRNTINENTSEFRFMPDDGSEYNSVLSNLYDKGGKSFSKFSDIATLSINKNQFSRYLGRQELISRMSDDSHYKVFKESILSKVDDEALLDNHLLWGRIIGIMVVNHKWGELKDFINRIVEIIKKMEVVLEDSDFCKNIFDDKVEIQMGLLHELLSALVSRSILVWNEDCSRLLNDCYDVIFNASLHFQKNRSPGFRLLDPIEHKILPITVERMNDLRRGYCISRMIPKMLLAAPIDGFIGDGVLNLNDDDNIDLFDLDSILRSDNYMMDSVKMVSYPYRPYVLRLSDVCICDLISSMMSSDDLPSDSWNGPNNDLVDLFMKINYRSNKSNDCWPDIFKIYMGGQEHFAVCIEDDDRKTMKVALANSRIPNVDVLKDVLMQIPNRSIGRYHSIQKIVDEAIFYKSNMVVFPECSIPMPYLPLLIKKCSDNNMVAVCGIEYLVHKRKVFNLVATILPFKDEYGENDCFVLFHLKKHYAPSEYDEVLKAGHCCVRGGNPALIGWNNFWFTSLCCFEAASVEDRYAFKFLVDSIIFVEYNRDVKYYSNIVESTVRDMHCYCIQSNNSTFGDSRITEPSKTEIADFVKIKGGEESNAIIGTIDLDRLRKYQLAPNDNNRFKPLPPGFNRESVQNRILGKEKQYLKSKYPCKG